MVERVLCCGRGALVVLVSVAALVAAWTGSVEAFGRHRKKSHDPQGYVSHLPSVTVSPLRLCCVFRVCACVCLVCVLVVLQSLA